MASGQNSSGNTLMDLISSAPTTAPAPAAPSSRPSEASVPSQLGKPAATVGKPKRSTLMQIQSDTIAAAKALNPVRAIPQRQKTTPVSYSQLLRSVHELAATYDQRSSQKQLVNRVFPKLAVYSSVDPSVAPSLLMLLQQSEDRNVLRYVYYYLARILYDSDPEGLSPGGGIPTPNWDAVADIDVVGRVTRADVIPRVVNQLSAEATNADIQFHARRLAALKALTAASANSSEILEKLYEIVFGILEKIGDVKQKPRKSILVKQGGDKESIHDNLQYAALGALRRLPLDPGNPLFLHRAIHGISCGDPVAMRHAVAIITDIATRDPNSVAMALGKHIEPGGALHDILRLHDVLARVYLARLCYVLCRARALDERPGVKFQFTSLLYQLLLDPSDRVCFEAMFCILGKFDNTERTEERAAGWIRLTREVLKLPEAPSVTLKDADNPSVKPNHGKRASKAKPPQLLMKLVIRRLESSFRSFSRPVLHGAARVVQEMGKSRAAAYALGVQVDEAMQLHSSENDDPPDSQLMGSSKSAESHKTLFPSTGPGGIDTIASLLASLLEVVRTTVACECVYVRAMVIKALIWMQNPHESFEELGSIIASELSDPAWPSSQLNDILLTLHARFKATPGMAVTLLEIARIFATKVPGKIDADVLQLLWKTCLAGAGPEGKHTALEAVTIVLDLPPPQPGLGLVSVDRVSASDPKSALALQRLVQAAVWFLGENANYAASEYAWESATPPATALMMLDADKMVAAASSRNPTLAGALTRLQRCAFSGSWEVRIVAAQALMTIAIRSGEPYRLQIYEFLHALALGGVQSQFSQSHFSNGEDQGASGTGIGSLISSMLKVLDEMYRAQDDLIRDMRNHDNNNKEWTDEELKTLYENHEKLLDLASLFCFVPRAKYLPLGPTSVKLIDIYRNRHNIGASTGLNDPAVVTGISDLVYESKAAPREPETIDPELAMAWAAGLEDDLLGTNTPALKKVNEFLAGAGIEAPDIEEEDENMISRPSLVYDDLWAKSFLETHEPEEDDGRSSGTSSPESTGSVETSISSHFGGLGYPSLFSSRPSGYGVSQNWENKSGNDATRFSNASSTFEAADYPVREETPPPPSYASTVLERFDTFENPLVGSGAQSFGSQDEERSSQNPQFGKALYDFTAGGDDELSLTAGEEVEIDDEVDGWYYVKKKRPGRDGRMAGLVPVLYISSSS
ncbi:uncharacterized protein LOC141847287 isoform X1 [Curcuma longa]|uniref:uncharacterized protein LOC141847287 isoform X1 n=1 Tax=Curcuma longa TaxID=136217 RepID=UPI003D9EDFFD